MDSGCSCEIHEKLDHYSQRHSDWVEMDRILVEEVHVEHLIEDAADSNTGKTKHQ